MSALGTVIFAAGAFLAGAGWPVTGGIAVFIGLGIVEAYR